MSTFLSVIYQLGVSYICSDWEANYVFGLLPTESLLGTQVSPRSYIHAVWFMSASLSCSLFSTELISMGITQTNLTPEVQNYSLRYVPNT